MEKRKERRNPIQCPNCHYEMVCMNKFETIFNLIRGIYVWYVCPCRKGEGGCGHSVLFEVSPETKSPSRIIKKKKLDS